MPGINLTIREKLFWSKVKKTKSGCWLWTGWISPQGYGRFHAKGDKHILAHRIAYMLLHGKIPHGKTLDHLCRVRNCVNPDHLEIVSATENTMRGFGFGAKNARLTHCVKGHPLSGDNLDTAIAKKHGRRRCRICLRAYAKIYYAANIKKIKKRASDWYYEHKKKRTKEREHTDRTSDLG